jgi:CheY-like chemotaxis protein
MQAELLREKTELKPQVSQVLYIDDDAEISTLVRYSLELFDGWYAATTDGQYALNVATASPWDVILLEVALEGGLSLYRQLKADPHTRAIPMVLLTSRVMPADLQGYGQMAIAGVIAKPFNPVTLGAQIVDLLG